MQKAQDLQHVQLNVRPSRVHIQTAYDQTFESRTAWKSCCASTSASSSTRCAARHLPSVSAPDDTFRSARATRTLRKGSNTVGQRGGGRRCRALAVSLRLGRSCPSRVFARRQRRSQAAGRVAECLLSSLDPIRGLGLRMPPDVLVSRTRARIRRMLRRLAFLRRALSLPFFSSCLFPRSLIFATMSSEEDVAQGPPLRVTLLDQADVAAEICYELSELKHPIRVVPSGSVAVGVLVSSYAPVEVVALAKAFAFKPSRIMSCLSQTISSAMQADVLPVDTVST